jgi:hypothetical protein
VADAKTNIKVAAAQASLNPKENQQVDSLIKLLDTHQNLSNMPAAQAQQAYAKLPADQQQSLKQTFGAELPDPNKRSPLSTAWHYTGGAVFGALNEISDFMTRLYRANEIARTDKSIQGRGTQSLIDAWNKANDKGDQVFNPTRIDNAKAKYGDLRTNVAMKVAAGQALADILANGTEEEKVFAAKAAKGQDNLFQDTLDAVQAAKYSPGRQVANALLPGGLEGSGFLYKGISGTVDAAYRIFADPTLALGKAKKAYDAANYAMFKIVGDANKVDATFAKPQVVNFFNSYGKELDKLATARKSKDIKAAVEASTNLKRLAPEFGPAAVDEFIKAGVKDAGTAKNYLANHADVQKIMQGQPGRVTPLIPKMDLARRARVATYTAADKVFNIDRVGQDIVTALYGKAPQYEDVTTGLNAATDAIAQFEKPVGKLKGAKDGAVRFSVNQIQGRIDRFARKFTTVPYFKEGFFDVNSYDAADKIYQIARLGNSRYHSKIIKEAFTAGDEGQRKQIFTGLWNTVAEIRGVSKSTEGKSFMDEFAGRGLDKMYAPDIVRNGENIGNPASFDGQQMALFPYQLSSGIAVPSVQDLDRLSARAGLINRILGLSHKNWADKLTSLWTIGTLAGPRFAVRNATEDLMMHLAIGDSAWGIAKGRALSTRLRIARGLSAGETTKETLKKTASLDVEAGELGVINKFIRKDESARYAADLAKAQTPEEVRQVFAKAVLENNLAVKLDPQGAQYIADLAKYGNLDATLNSVAEGGKNALRGGDRYLSVTQDVSKYGKMGELEINGVRYKQSTGDKAFTQFNPVANQQARVSWLVQLGITTNDELAKIAVRNLDNREVAIKEMRDYLSGLNPKLRNRFQLYSAGGNVNVHAERAYEAVKNLFSKRNGEINQDLLNKVRYVDKSGKLTVSSKNLTIDDLPGVGDASLVPEYISGPTLVPVADSGNFAASLADKTWDAMGEANARFSREPIVLNEIVRIRKEMADSGFEQRFTEQLTKGVFNEELKAAEAYAKKQIVELSEQLAMNRVLAYVDNPAVRSQLAMTVRNFGRFYRATEDFYRRMARMVRYNPESIVRASLTYEGIAHSGFVQQDDNGDSYFFYPGLTPVYQTMQGVANSFNFPEAFKIPMPVEFGGKLNMITPSLNPDSLFPTFAGPLAAVPMKFVFGLVPQLDSLESVFLGTYAQDQPMVNAIFPAHVTRLLAALNRDERNSQYASAFRKAATYLEATGHGVKPRWDEATQTWIAPSEAELNDYKKKISAATTTVLLLRFVTGFFAPASPQVNLKSEMEQWVRDNKSVSFKQSFNQLISKYNDIDKATKEWLRLFPDEMPYTVSESDDNVVSVIRAVDSTVNWIKDNNATLTKYPQGAPFLMPKVGDFNFDAYRLLFKSGIKYSKTIDNFLQDVSTARDKQFYYTQKDAFDAELATTYDDFSKQNLKQQWDDWSKQFKAVRPMLQKELSGGAETAIARRNAYQDLQNMLADESVRKVAPQTFDTLKKMSEIYDSYVYNSDIAVGSGAAATAYKDMLKQNTKAALQQLASTNANAQDAYNVMFSGLLGE